MLLIGCFRLINISPLRCHQVTVPLIRPWPKPHQKEVCNSKTKTWQYQRFTTAPRTLLNDSQKRLLFLNQEHGASSWLSTLPLESKGSHLSKQCFQDLKNPQILSAVHRFLWTMPSRARKGVSSLSVTTSWESSSPKPWKKFATTCRSIHPFKLWWELKTSRKRHFVTYGFLTLSPKGMSP